MKRFVSVWLPAWPIERLARASPQAFPSGVASALVEDEGGKRVVTAVTEKAARAGIRPGMALNDARAILPGLAVRPAEPRADIVALRRLARWCGRYGPNRNIVRQALRAGGDHGIWIDVSGVAHLFGGEQRMLADLAGRLAGFGFSARLALADTYGAAHALARHGACRRASFAIAPPGESRAALALLPVAGLRLTGDAVRLLMRLGLTRIGDLYGLPRAALARRFRDEDGKSRHMAVREASALATAVLVRLDAALGLAAEPLQPLGTPPRLVVRRSFPEPLVSGEGISAAVADVAEELCASLAAAGLGARRIRLVLYRADGTVTALDAGTSLPCRSVPHMLRLMTERLDKIDAGFGIDVVALEAISVSTLDASQAALDAGAAAGASDLGRLVDILASRLGRSRVQALAPRQSYLPERTQAALAVQPERIAASELAPWPQPPAPGERPPLLLPSPEPITVMAEIPEGPPMRFTWRRLQHRVQRAEGPERIAPEWWCHLPPAPEEDAGDAVAASTAPRPRDYYRVEVEGGARFWIFRDGLYGAASDERPPRWFVHGLFG